MEDIALKAGGGFITFLFGLFGWMFKGTAEKANNAASMAESLKEKVSDLEEGMKTVQDMAVSTGKVEVRVEGIESTVQRIEHHLMGMKGKS